MSRELSSPFIDALTGELVYPAFLAKITFASQIVCVWTGPYTLEYDGQSWLGVGDFGRISDVIEGSEVQAEGMTIGLSGIDPNLLSECLDDIQLGAPAVVYFALLDGNGNVIGAPELFSGAVDPPSILPGTDTITIDLALEDRMTQLNRGSNRRYTAADQNIYYPTDSGFNWVERLSDIALNWGQS